MFMFYDVSAAAFWMWLILAVIFFIVEACTVGLTSLWFGGAAIVAALVSLVTDNVLLQLFAFVVISLVLVIFTRPIALKKLNVNVVKTNADALIGKVGTVESAIAKNQPGTVKADNKTWTAVLTEDSAQVMQGENVIIEAIEGVKLIVRKERT